MNPELLAQQREAGLPEEPLIGRTLRYDAGSKSLVLNVVTKHASSPTLVFVRRAHETRYQSLLEVLGESTKVPARTITTSWILAPNSLLYATLATVGAPVERVQRVDSPPRMTALPVWQKGIMRLNLLDLSYDLWPAHTLESQRIFVNELVGSSDTGGDVFATVSGGAACGRIDYSLARLNWDDRIVEVLNPMPSCVF